MKALLPVLARGVAAAFYRHYAGWLIGAGLLLGGVLSNTEHATLIREAVGDWRVLAGVYLLPWTLYAGGSARFAARLWAQPAYAPLRVLRLVPAPRRWAVGLLTQALILAPCWAYGGLIVVFAARAGASGALLLTLGTLALLTAGGWAAHERALRAPEASGAGAARGAGWWPPVLWGIRAQLHAHPLGTGLTKGAAVGAIWAIGAAYAPATFEVRFLALGALVTAALALRLPAELYAWERGQLAFRANLPIGVGRHWWGRAGLYGAWLLPELLAWVYWCPLPGGARWLGVARLTLFPLAALLLAGATLPRWPQPPAVFLGRALLALFGTYLLVLAGVPLDALTGGALAGSLVLTHRYYWRADDAPITPPPAALPTTLPG